jgi:hypothetical protein
LHRHLSILRHCIDLCQYRDRPVARPLPATEGLDVEGKFATERPFAPVAARP